MSPSMKKTNPKRRITMKKRQNKRTIEKIEMKNGDLTTIIPPSVNNTMDRKQVFVQFLDDLSYIMRKKKDFMRSKAYSNAKETIMNRPSPVTLESLKGVPTIGKTIYEKLSNFDATNNDDLLVQNQDLLNRKYAISAFLDVYGIGEKKAEELVEQNIISIDQLRTQQHLLNNKQKIGLQYYEDILERIPRKEIQAYEKIFLKMFPQKENLEIVGSYRRGAETSGDIDVILTCNKEMFDNFINSLIEKKIIIEVLSRGPKKCLVITKLNNRSVARRVDFLCTSKDEFYFAILYFTGSKEFNIKMREQALKMGYTLNEYGFSKIENKKKGERLEREFPSEESIFEFLEMEYKSPNMRTIDL